MYLEFLSQANIVMAISIVIMLAFIVALFFAYKNYCNNVSVFITSSVLVANFVIANNVVYEMLAITAPAGPDFYLRWVQYNALSIIAIIAIHLALGVKHHKISLVTMYLLLINVIMYLAMHIDIILNGNRTPWLLWYVYTPVVNITEISIAVMIIVYSAFHNALWFKKTKKDFL